MRPSSFATKRVNRTQLNIGKTDLDIAIGICTYDRVDDLQSLLVSIRQLTVDPDISLRVIVVDNDEKRTAEQAVRAWAQTVDWRVNYVHEPEPGIPMARNRVLTEAGTEGYLAFVDDDETVDPDWMSALVRAMRQTGAAFVQGPVEMTVEDTSDTWWLSSGFFRQRTFPDLALRHESWTNNVLIDLAFIHKTGCRFDPCLQFDGGSDTLFFQDIVAAGGEGRFARHAIVFEVQKPARLTWSWGVKRHYRYGITRSNTTVLRKPFWNAFGYCATRAAAMFTLGLLQLPTGLVRGRKGLADGLALIARSAGVVSGLFGGKHKEYAR